MAHDLYPLTLPARQARALPGKAEIAQPYGDEAFEARRQGCQHRTRVGRLKVAHQPGQVTYLHRRQLSDISSRNPAPQCLSLEPCALAGGGDLAREDAVIFDAAMGLQCLRVLVAHNLTQLGHHAQVSEVDFVDLDLTSI